MIKYEYKQIQTCAGVENCLNEWGKEGWELVSVTSHTPLHSRMHYTYYFKRAYKMNVVHRHGGRVEEKEIL